MHLILLPGSRKTSNETWIQGVQGVLSPLFESGQILRYRHWDTGEESTDIERESGALRDLVSGLNEYLIFAKSIGTLVALSAIHGHGVRPAKCIFVGSALGWALNEHYPLKEYFSGYFIPTLFIQKTHDPAIAFADLRAFVEGAGVPNCRFVEIPGDNHQYEYLEQLKTLVNGFLP